MINAIVDGTVDCIASHHLPHEYDSKVLEFENAKFGMIGLETVYAVLNTVVPDLSQERIVMLLALNPGRIFGLSTSSIMQGNKATITLFDPFRKWTVTPADIKSKSSNSPFIGKELTGKVCGIINGDKIMLS